LIVRVMIFIIPGLGLAGLGALISRKRTSHVAALPGALPGPVPFQPTTAPTPSTKRTWITIGGVLSTIFVGVLLLARSTNRTNLADERNESRGATVAPIRGNKRQ
jgi:hypothetical protein